MTSALNVHPFPAKMAPEIVSDYISALSPGTRVLDPMMGSGSFVVSAAAAGHSAVGVDSDPLALVITSAAIWNGEASEVLDAAQRMVERPLRVSVCDLVDDAETRQFIDFWFDPDAQRALASLAAGIRNADSNLRAPLWCAFSRLIITKDSGASRARDVSHSRPHVVRDAASFDPLERFVGSLQTVLSRRRGPTNGAYAAPTLLLGDTRSLPLADSSVGAVMTSPPYLTAIDYLRGHRMSLVWMGHTVGTLRALRGSNVGSERGSDLAEDLTQIRQRILDGELAPARNRIVNRYLGDLDRMLSEMARVLHKGGHATFVVANSTHRGTAVRVDDALTLLGSRHGFSEVKRVYRLLPENRRYLPPPREGSANLDRRMRTETLLTLST